MSTDAVIQFKYSDDVHLTAIYKRYDSFPEKVIQKLKSYLSETKNKQQDFLVAEIISRFVFDSVDNKGVKMLYQMPLEGDSSFIFLWEIYPKEELYCDETIPFEKSIYVNIWQGNKQKLIYSGSIQGYEWSDD